MVSTKPLKILIKLQVQLMVSTEKEKNKMALYVLFKNKNTLLFFYIFCFLFNLQMCEIILTDLVVFEILCNALEIIQILKCFMFFHFKQFFQ